MFKTCNFSLKPEANDKIIGLVRFGLGLVRFAVRFRLGLVSSFILINLFFIVLSIELFVANCRLSAFNFQVCFENEPG